MIASALAAKDLSCEIRFDVCLCLRSAEIGRHTKRGKVNFIHFLAQP
jgi:hypothetical protein